MPNLKSQGSSLALVTSLHFIITNINKHKKTSKTFVEKSRTQNIYQSCHYKALCANFERTLIATRSDRINLQCLHSGHLQSTYLPIPSTAGSPFSIIRVVVLSATEQMDTRTESTAAAPTLLGLPLELFQHIAECTTKQDLRALRQTSSDCSQKVWKVHKEAHFSDRTVLLSTSSSIRHAIEVLEHPIVGGAVQKLSLVDNSLPSPFCPEANHRNEVVDMAAWRMQGTAQNKEEKIRLLCCLFSTFEQVAVVSNVHLSLNIDAPNFSAIDRRRKIGVDRSNVDIFEWIMAAMVFSGVKLNAFSIDTTAFDGFRVIDSSWRPEYMTQTYKTALYHHFELFDLVLRVDDFDTDDMASAQSSLAAFGTPTLRSLKIVVPYGRKVWSIGPEALVDAVLSLEFPRLETLEITSVEVGWDALVSFLRNQPVLRELRLRKTYVVNVPEHMNKLDAIEELKGVSGKGTVVDADCGTIFGDD
jgi:hypothetical protein